MNRFKESILNRILKYWIFSLYRNTPLLFFLQIYMIIPSLFEPFETATNVLSFIVFAVFQPFVISCLLTTIASFKRWLYWTIFSLATLLFFCELCALFIQSSRITTPIFLFIMQSNLEETTEFIQGPGIISSFGKALSVILFTSAVFIIFKHFWEKEYDRNKALFLHRSYKLSLSLIGALIICSIADFYYVNSLFVFDWQRVNALYKASTPLAYKFIYTDVFTNPEIKGLDRLDDCLQNIKIESTGSDSLNIVYVIGESHSKARSSLYGYYKDTNPLLKELHKDSSLILLNDVVTHAMATKAVFKELMSMHHANDTADWNNKPLLPAIMKKSGYYVQYLSNQSDNLKHLDFSCSYFFGKIGICQKSFDTNNTSIEQYDLDFINRYPPDLKSKHNFIIYHLMGQHRAPNKRFPPEFVRFKPSDYNNITPFGEEAKQLMADYDNACLYNDTVLYNIISKVKDSISIVFYTPDHGEECYDYRDYFGRKANSSTDGSIKIVHQLPVFIWISPKFKAKYPDKVIALKRAVNRPIFNSDIVHTIVDVAGIETPSLDYSFSLLRDSVALPDRIIYGKNYDQNKQRIDSLPLYYDKQK